MGNTNRPFYRVVAIDERKRRDGRAIEELGWYDPVKKPAQTRLNEEPILQWLDRGAQPSETVREMLREHGLLLKWELLRAGVTAEDATAKVAAHLESRTVKAPKERLSKKARAKAVARAEESAAAEAAPQAAPEAPAEAEPASGSDA
jgi:small subunit ribosomal protein S16